MGFGSLVIGKCLGAHPNDSNCHVLDLCFLFLRGISEGLVDRLGYAANWKTIDLWNDLGMVGSRILGIADEAKTATRNRSLWSSLLLSR